MNASQFWYDANGRDDDNEWMGFVEKTFAKYSLYTSATVKYEKCTKI